MIVLIVAVSVLGVSTVTLGVLLAVSGYRLRSSRRRVTELERGLVERPPRGALAGLAGRAGRAVRAVSETATVFREDGVGGVIGQSLDVIERWAREDRATIVRVAAPDGTATVVFTDIENSTTLNDTLGDKRWLEVLAAHDHLVRRSVERHHGHIVKNQGDGFMIIFGRPDAAVSAAIDLQRSLDDASARALRRNPIRVRIGAHCGPVVGKDGDFYGRNVAAAARVAALADGGEILISAAVADALGPRFVLDDRGTHPLKGLSEQFRLDAVRWRES